MRAIHKDSHSSNKHQVLTIIHANPPASSSFSVQQFIILCLQQLLCKSSQSAYVCKHIHMYMMNSYTLALPENNLVHSTQTDPLYLYTHIQVLYGGIPSLTAIATFTLGLTLPHQPCFFFWLYQNFRTDTKLCASIDTKFVYI